MQVKVNGKKVNIKPYKELTLKEYVNIIEIIRDKGSFSPFDYIALETGYKYDELLLQKITNIEPFIESLGLLKLIRGESESSIECIENLPFKRFFVYKGKLYDFSQIKMSSKFGYRVVIEQYLVEKPTYLNLYIFAFAAVLNEIITGTFDFDSIKELAEDLQEYNAYDILGNGAFFLSNLMNGERKGWRFLRELRHIMTRIAAH